MTYTLNGNFLKHLHLVFCKRAGRSHHDGFTSMDTQRVKVFHACHGETTVVGIADYLEFDFLPSLQTLLNQYLRCESERRFCQFDKRLLILTNSRAQTAKRIGRTDHDGVTDATSRLNGIFNALASLAYGNLHVYLIKFLYKQVSVLSVHDGFHTGTENLHSVLLQRTIEVKFCTAVERCLSTKSQKDTIGTFLFDNFGYKVSIYRKEIYLVSNSFTCLDCSNIRIDQN